MNIPDTEGIASVKALWPPKGLRESEKLPEAAPWTHMSSRCLEIFTHSNVHCNVPSLWKSDEIEKLLICKKESLFTRRELL